MKAVFIALLSCLLLLCARGQPAGPARQCRCLNGFVNVPRFFTLKSIKDRPQVTEPHPFCPHTEIIITIRNKQKCVDPESRLGKKILTWSRGGQTGAAQTSTSAPRRPQTTSGRTSEPSQSPRS
ncbi:growth-regulated alpha protein-like [Oryzias latipes]|uniref:Chemokine interleukin-8-like domain-containing protein n=1 Tax=Oryzias latipes TaxID=8090 RepID=A0A3B3HBM7_ORYLA